MLTPDCFRAEGRSMLDYKTQAQFVDAAASIWRAYLRATSDALAASAGRNWSLWTQILATAHPPGATWPAPAGWTSSSGGAGTDGAPLALISWAGPGSICWAPIADWCVWSAGFMRAATSNPLPPPPSSLQGQARTEPEASFARYRSAGGHAVAQVRIPTTDEPASLPAEGGRPVAS
jgi:hypothetical protein